ncbi:hypothetical protein PLAN_40162 [Planktothrix rubescens CCAP 1459/22]|uniref:Uncharacterized protein n=1 Tax=Planktothrix rubescens CCAP 1459/22 TaxID=329571 RepID=A0A6J7ZMG9_PLARU|nr:hypothetical protein PLAN_40162 [Planktothrix rubescens NIVA-CYA 18]
MSYILGVYTSHIVLSISEITELSFHIFLKFRLNLPLVSRAISLKYDL